LAEVAAAGAAAGRTSDVIDVGWVEAGHLAPELDEVAWQLAVGETSQPVEGRGGLHILQLEERREARLRPFEEVRELILRQERQRRTAQRYVHYIRELEGRAFIEMNLPPEAAGFTGLGPLGDEPLAEEGAPLEEEGAEPESAER